MDFLRRYFLVALAFAAVGSAQAETEARPALSLSTMHDGYTTNTELTDDGSMLFTQADNELRVWDRGSRKLLKTLHADFDILALEWLEIEQKLLVVTKTGIKLWDRSTMDWGLQDKGQSYGENFKFAYDAEWDSMYILDGSLKRYDLKTLQSESLMKDSYGFVFPNYESPLMYRHFKLIDVVPGDFDKVVIATGTVNALMIYNTDFERAEKIVGLDLPVIQLRALSNGRFLCFQRDTNKEGNPYIVSAYETATLRKISEITLAIKGDKYVPELRLEQLPATLDSKVYFKCRTLGYVREIELKDDVLSARVVLQSQADTPFVGGLLMTILRLPSESDAPRLVLTGAGAERKVITEFSPASKRPEFLSYEFPAMPLHGLAVHPTLSEFITWKYNGPAKRVRWVGSRFQVEAFAEAVTGVSYSGDGKMITFRAKNGTGAEESLYYKAILKSGMLSQAKPLLTDRINNREYSLSGDGAQALITRGETGNFEHYRAASSTDDLSLRSLRKIGPFGGVVRADRVSGIIWPDGQRYVLPVHRSDVPKDHPDAYRIFVVDGEGTVLREIDSAPDMEGLRVWNEDQFALVSSGDSSRSDTWFSIFDINTGEKVKSFKIGGADKSIFYHRHAINESKTRIALEQDRKCSIFDIATGKQVASLPEAGGRIVSLAFLDDGRWLLTTDHSSRVKLWDAASGELRGELILIDGSNEYVFTHNDSFFMASPGAAQEVYFVEKEQIVPLDTLFKQFHTPGLWSSVLAGEQFQDTLTTRQLLSAPTVELQVVDAEGSRVEGATEQSQVRITVTGIPHGSPIEAVHLYHNEKLVSTKTRGLLVEDDDALEEDGRQQVYALELLPGDNVFRAVAINEDAMESRPLRYVVRKDRGTVGGIRLHLLAVGVNLYENPKYNLNYAKNDATAFYEAVLQGAKSMFSSVESTLLTDAQVDKASVISALKAIADTAGPRDVFVFYYAGHGVMVTDESPMFYLVPPAVTQMYGATSQLETKGISAELLRELSAQIPAQKQLFILDACQSAGALQTVAMRGAAEEKAIAQLARSTGTHWLTASGSEQFAAEFATLGHGAFTYAILEAIKGVGDNGDGQLTVNELDLFIQNRVPELTREHRGSPQYPSSFGYGQDFPIGVIGR